MRDIFEFIKRKVHWFLFLLLEIVGMGMLFQYNNYQSSIWFSTANSIAGKLLEWDSAVGAHFNMKTVNEELTLRNYYLERQVEQLRRLYAEKTEGEGATAAALLPQQPSLDGCNPISAKVIANTTNRRDNLITIDKGAADGIEPDMGVVSGNGVVGVVYLVGEHYSVVMSALNTQSNISCAIRNRNYMGYLHWNGGDTGIAYVDDIPRHAHFKRGEWVATSGYSSIFPRGVLVGKIEEVFNSHDGLYYRLRVRLSTDFANLRDVLVVKNNKMAVPDQLLQAARDSLDNATKSKQ